MSLHAETVVDAIITALSGISTGSGNSFTPVSVERLDRAESSIGPNTLQVSVPDMRHQRTNQGGDWRVDLGVRVVFTRDRQVTSPASDKQCNLAYQDIAQAVAGIDWEATQADLAEITRRTFIEEDETDPDDGVIVEFAIRYKVAFANFATVIDPS